MPRRDALPTKPCAHCGRVITWRKKWERDWESVRHCSDACRRGSRSEASREARESLERAVLELLRSRPRDASACPSEIARLAAGPDDWRTMMEPVRRAARRLVAEGLVEITQGGRVVDASRARGPIRIRLARR